MIEKNLENLEKIHIINTVSGDKQKNRTIWKKSFHSIPSSLKHENVKEYNWFCFILSVVQKAYSPITLVGDDLKDK